MGPISEPAGIAIAVMIGIIGFAAAKIVWGVLLWTRRSDFRIGQRWGDEPGEVTEWATGKGYVSAGGELWQAISRDALAPGDKVTVSKVKGLTLEVRKG